MIIGLKSLLLIAVFASLLGCSGEAGTQNSGPSEDHQVTAGKSMPPAVKKSTPALLRQQYEAIDSIVFLEGYVTDVINEGSDLLGLPAGNMAAGYADPSDAPKIAAYVVSIAGKRPSRPEHIEEGSLYYAGNCSGCHGSDGKGMGGAYPDLTLPMLEGITLKKSALKRQIDARMGERAAD